MISRVSVFVYVLLSYHSIGASPVKEPTLVISTLIRNKAHTLPYFLTSLGNLNYPKERISLWIKSDRNVDKSAEILKKWLDSVRDEYHHVDIEISDTDNNFEDEIGPAHWSDSRFEHVINLRESALNYARKHWADYLLVIDSDVFLIDPDAIQVLIDKNCTVTSPMLNSVGLYSNFWYGMGDDYYYLRTEDYEPVVHREKMGCFMVPMVHSCVLIDLRRRESDFLTYLPERVKNYDGPRDDIITFAIAANRSAIDLNVCNDKVYGFIMTPLEKEDSLEYDYRQLTNLKLEVSVENEPLKSEAIFRSYVTLPDKDTLGFDQIFMINLARRTERRKRMQYCFDQLGLDVTIIDAVDGKALNESVLRGIHFLPEYADPYHKRPMTLGEIGCFLSHYKIWKEIVEKGYETTLVLEDDVRFEPFFREKVQRLMFDLEELPGWDLVYFGRKRLQDSDEPWVEGSDTLVKVSYSYWTLGYVLSVSGARKLLAAEPLSRLVPVDEYLPILFDKHPQVSWKSHFPKRDLVAFSAAPLLIYPTHYTGEEGYISDTEDSKVVANEIHTDL